MVQVRWKFNQTEAKPVTVGIVVACKDGVVVGADRKVTRSRGTRIKSLEDKIRKLSFRDGRPLLICSSGGADMAKRAIEAVNPSDCDRETDGALFRDRVESRISWLSRDLAQRGLEYDATLLFGMIDGDQPFIGHITPSGLTETSNTGYYTTGIAAPYAELVLKDSYSAEINVEDAKLIVAGLIEKIGTVDNDVEGTDVSYISIGRKMATDLSWAERMGLRAKPLSFNFKEELDEVKESIGRYKQLEKTIAETEEKRKKPES